MHAHDSALGIPFTPHWQRQPRDRTLLWSSFLMSSSFHCVRSSSSLSVWISMVVFFKVGHLHCAGFKVACKHSQHLRSAGKTFGSCMLLKPSRAIPTQQCTSQIQEWTDMHKAIQLRREQTEWHLNFCTAYLITQNMSLKPRAQMFQPRLVSRWPLLIGACTQCHLKSLGRLQIRRIYTNTTSASEDSSCDHVMFKWSCWVKKKYMYMYIDICTYIAVKKMWKGQEPASIVLTDSKRMQSALR